MKIKLLFCLSMLSSHFLTAQCALEKQLLGRWIWANTAEIVAVFQFNKDKTVDLFPANESLKKANTAQWTLAPDCSLIMKNHLNPEDASTIELTAEGLLVLSKKIQHDEFGLALPPNKIVLKRLSNDNQAVTQYLNGLKKSYPEIYYEMKHKEERSIAQKAYMAQREKADAAAQAKAAVEAAAAAAASNMAPVTPPAAEATTAPDPATGVIHFTDEMSNLVLQAGNSEPNWTLNIRNGYANFFATDADKSPTVDISIPMTAYMTQTIDKVVVKVLQFQDMAVQGRILTVVISENGQNSCKKSDGTFKYTVSAEFQGKKYTGCGQ
ncbi:MAG: hypothetical protein RIS64_4402 [Bacteroidota bacterium]|jgi:hypothetical protein